MLAHAQWKMLENAQDPLDWMNRKSYACVCMCINTVMICSGVCMNWYREGTLLKCVCVCVCVCVLCLHWRVTQHRHSLDLGVQVTGWHNVVQDKQKDGWRGSK